MPSGRVAQQPRQRQTRVDDVLDDQHIAIVDIAVEVLEGPRLGMCMQPRLRAPVFGIAKEINAQFVFAYDPGRGRRIATRDRR